MRTLTEVFAPGAPALPEGLRTLAVSPGRTVEPGATVRATFAFYNFGGAAATGLRVRFALPEGLRYVSGSAKVDDRSLDDVRGETALLGPNGADVGEVPPGVERRITLSYTVAPTIENGAPILLQAALVANETEVIGSNVVRLVAQSAPELRDAETVAAIEAIRVAAPGEEIRCSARIRNGGHATAHDVVVVLPVPDRTAYVSGSARIDGREAALDERGGDPFGLGNAAIAATALAPGATLVVEYRARIATPLEDSTRILLTGAVASAETPEFELTAAALTVRSESRFDTEATRLAIDAPAEVEPGRRVRIALLAENAGTCAAEDVRLSMTLPDGLRYAPGSRAIDGRSVSESDAPGLFVFPRVDAGRRIEAAVDAYVVSPAADSTPLPIAATLQWGTGSRTFERTLTIRSTPRFLETRNALTLQGPAQVTPGSEVRALIHVANDGTAQATGVRVIIDVDATLQNVRTIDESGSETRLPESGIDIGSLAPGAARTFTLAGSVASPIADRSTIRLRGRLETAQTPALVLGSIELVVRSRPRFAPATSTLAYPSGEPLRPSAYGDVKVALANDGTDVARDVRVTIDLSDGARLEAVDGATRVGNALLFGDVAPGARVEATARLQLARIVARGTTITVESRIESLGLLPLALAPITIPTIAEARFDGASLRTEPVDGVDAGEPLYLRLSARNTGDGAASRLVVRAQVPPHTAYLPNSTTINDVPLMDVAGGSVLWSPNGLVLEDLEPGVELAVRWCVIVNTPLPAGTLIEPPAELAWDGDASLPLAAPAVRVRSTPVFAVRASGLPFSVSGVAPRTADVLRDLAETRRAAVKPPVDAPLPPAPFAAAPPSFTEPPAAEAPPPAPSPAREQIVPEEARFVPQPEAPAYEPEPEPEPIAPSASEPLVEPEPQEHVAEPPAAPVFAAPPVAEHLAGDADASSGLRTRLVFARDALERAVAFLEQSDYGGLVTHLFAIRTLLPTSFVGVNGDVPGRLAAEREALRGVIDRLFIKMRMPRYAITAKDLEDRASRTALLELADALSRAHPADDPGTQGAPVVLEGEFDPKRVAAHLRAVGDEPLGSPRPWLALAELLPTHFAQPEGGEALNAYRSALIATFTNVVALPSEEFYRVLADTQNPALDAALRDVRAALRDALEASAARA